MKKKISLVSLLIVIALLGSLVFTYAYLYQSIKKDELKEIGTVLVSPNVYFQNDVKEKPVLFETINGNTKKGIYAVNVSNEEDPYHINKLRVEFNVNSNIETYFRIRVIDTLVLRYVRNDNKTVEQVQSNEGIKYELANDWYFDNNSGWYYYQNKVFKKDNINTTILFITEGLKYDLLTPQHQIQFGIKVEAVQGVLGPQKNWGLSEKPWPNGGSW